MRDTVTRRRQLLAALALAALAATAGCSLLGSQQVSEERLGEPHDYDWATGANVTINVTGGQFHAVYNVSNRSELGLYRTDGLGNERPLPVSAVRYRHANGTVVNGTNISVTRTRSRTVVALPPGEGQLGITAPSRAKRFSTRTFVGGSHEVLLPPGTRTGGFVFGSVQPGGYEIEREGDRVHVLWEDVSSQGITVRYYLPRDLAIFLGAGGLLALVALGGAAYFLLQIRQLAERREELGLDVDVDDDEFGRDPPPGMG